MAVATNVSCQAHPLIPNPASSLSHAACAQGGKMHSISCCDGCDFSPLSRTILSPGGKRRRLLRCYFLLQTGDGTVAALEPMPTLVGVEDVDSDVTDYPSWTR
ncbi:Os04g0411000 [Oryza sativa Japonica Group]|uniref:Os04g0411000 protein n=1 Tax=Oryza sativa subsp. japonica TaxID=39947 RepID=A0A0P0WA99_ORYSJ|nr:Os04g0411000 [Oryza sativa Japonica Group]